MCIIPGTGKLQLSYIFYIMVPRGMLSVDNSFSWDLNWAYLYAAIMKLSSETSFFYSCYHFPNTTAHVQKWGARGFKWSGKEGEREVQITVVPADTRFTRSLSRSPITPFSFSHCATLVPSLSISPSVFFPCCHRIFSKNYDFVEIISS